MTARILDITPAVYHTDPCARPSLSCSLAHTLITRSPLHAWTEHPKFGNVRDESTKDQNDGSIIHKLLLGKGVDVQIVSGYDNFQTKAARMLRDEAVNAGRVPILEHKYAAIQTAAERIRENLAAQGCVLNGASEVAIEWEEQGELGPVLCRSMLDHVFLGAGAIIDVKKIISAAVHTCTQHNYAYGYDIQAYAYPRALAALRPELAGRVDFKFAYCEMEPPYAVRFVPPDGVMRELGARRWARAVSLWERCLARDHWPSYNDTINPISVPAWALTQEEFAEAANL